MENFVGLIVFLIIVVANIISWASKQKQIQERKRKALQEHEANQRQAGPSTARGPIRTVRPVSAKPAQPQPRPVQPVTASRKQTSTGQQPPTTIRRIRPKIAPGAPLERPPLRPIEAPLERPTIRQAVQAREQFRTKKSPTRTGVEEKRRKRPKAEPAGGEPGFQGGFWANGIIVSEILQPPLSKRKRRL